MNTIMFPAILMNINYHTVALLSKLRGLPHPSLKENEVVGVFRVCFRRVVVLYQRKHCW